MAVNLKKLYITDEYGDNHRYACNAGADSASVVKTSGYFDAAVKERAMKDGDIIDVVCANNTVGMTLLAKVADGVVTVAAFSTGETASAGGGSRG